MKVMIAGGRRKKGLNFGSKEEQNEKALFLYLALLSVIFP